MNEPSQLNFFAWATRVAKRHPLVATLGVLGILITFTFTLGQRSNADFISILLALIGVSFALYYTFVPTPSMKRGVVALLLAVIWVSALVNVPFRIQGVINQILEPRLVVLRTPTLPATTATLPSATASTASAPVVSTPASASAPPPTIYVSRPILASSGSINVGCGETGSATATFTMPPGAILEGASASWANTSNVSAVTQSTTQSGANIVATGTIRGLDFQRIIGIPNCPGGGHGALVLSGTYRVPG